MKIKKILVPTDFSERADSALAAAVSLADQTGAEIDLLHIIDVPGTQGGMPSATDTFALSAKPNSEAGNQVPYMVKLIQYTQEKVQERKEKYPDVTIKEKVVFDRVHKHIYKFVEENDSDLVVIGSNGAEGWDEIAVGSNTERVIRNLDCPVLVVKNKLDQNYNPRNIVFASDFENPSVEAVSFFKIMKNWFNSTVHLVKIITPNNFETTHTTKERIEAFAKNAELEDYTVNFYNYYTEEEGILAFGDEINADIITLTTHGRTGVSRFLMGSIAENVANHAKRPIMTFKLPAE